MRTPLFALALLLAVAAPGLAQPIWPQFRGPNGTGVSALAAPPAEFGPTKNLRWSTATPPGHSSPVVVGDRLFLTAVDAGKLCTLCLDRKTGKELWRREAPAKSVEKVHSFASPAAPSPLADERRVVVYFGSCGLIAYDHAGKELWTKPLPTPKSTYGTAASPIRVGEAAVLVLDSNDKSSRLLAVNLADGATLWETPRPLAISAWATPMVWEQGGKSEIVVPGARRLVAYDSRTGKDAWWMDGFPPEVIGVPVAGEGLLFVSAAGLAGPPAEHFTPMTWQDMLRLDQNGDGKVQKGEVTRDFRLTLRPELPPDNPGRYLPIPFERMFGSVDGNRDGELTEAEFGRFTKQFGARSTPALKAIRPGGGGDVTQSHLAWEVRQGIAEIPSPLYHRGRIYMVRDGGVLACVKAADGKVLFEERVGARGAYAASPVAAGERVFVASHNGVVVSVDASGEEFKVLARNELGEKIWATPALGEGVIHVRTEKRVWTFGEGGED